MQTHHALITWSCHSTLGILEKPPKKSLLQKPRTFYQWTSLRFSFFAYLHLNSFSNIRNTNCGICHIILKCTNMKHVSFTKNFIDSSLTSNNGPWSHICMLVLCHVSYVWKRLPIRVEIKVRILQLNSCYNFFIKIIEYWQRPSLPQTGPQVKHCAKLIRNFRKNQGNFFTPKWKKGAKFKKKYCEKEKSL